MPEAPMGNGPLFGQSLRVPPSNVPVEQALLGAALANNKALNSVLDFLKPIHFADALHGRIFAEITRRVIHGSVADALVMRTWFEGDPEFSSAGSGYISQLVAGMVSLVWVRDYGLAIFECWQRRELANIAQTLFDQAFSGDPAIAAPAMIAGAVEALDKVTTGSGLERRAVSLNAAMDEVLADIDRASRGEIIPGLTTGFPSIDQAIGGLERKTLTMIAARPGMGKSAIAAQMALSAARDSVARQRAGAPLEGVFFVSLEMSAPLIARRLLAWQAAVAAKAIKFKNLKQADLDKLVLTRRQLNDLPLLIDDVGNHSVGAIRLKARAAKRRQGLSLIIIDHLHKIKPDDIDVRNGSTAAISKIGNALKSMAMELDVPIIACAQLSRGPEARDEKRPTLTDLRQSGELEQDADTVGFLFRPEYYLPKGSPERRHGEMLDKFNQRCAETEEARSRFHGKAELIFEKIREGSPCSVPLLWHEESTHFTEPSP